MLSDAELEELLSGGESDRVEWKSAIEHELDRIREAICAFANDLPGHRAPGVVFVGIHDDGRCAGLTISDKLILRLAGLRDEGKILPFPTMVVQKRVLRGWEMAVVVVEPSLDPPVRVDGRVWIRIGARRGIASTDDERRLLEKRRASDVPPDARPVSGAALDDLDMRRFQIEYLPVAVSPTVLAENNRPLLHQLRAFRFIGGDDTPTRTGLLVCGIEPRRWIPGAWIQFRRVAGVDLAGDTIDQEECGGVIHDQVRRIEEILDINTVKPLTLTRGRHRVNPVFPLPALQQVIRNAVLHRTYDGSNAPVRVTWFEDRLEVSSPGGPYGAVTAENFGQSGVTDYRNPTLAAAMKDLGLVERFGSGMAIIRQSLAANGNPPAEFSIEQNFVLVTIRPVP